MEVLKAENLLYNERNFGSHCIFFILNISKFFALKIFTKFFGRLRLIKKKQDISHLLLSFMIHLAYHITKQLISKKSMSWWLAQVQGFRYIALVYK